MFKTVQNMRKKTAGSSMEVINYNYARIVFEVDEVGKEADDGSRLIDKIVEGINSLKKEFKEEHDAEISAKISGGGKVILVSGVGKLHDNFTDGFKHVLKMKEKYFGSEEDEGGPAIERVSDTEGAKAPAVASEMKRKEKQPAVASDVKRKSKPLNKKLEKEEEAETEADFEEVDTEESKKKKIEEALDDEEDDEETDEDEDEDDEEPKEKPKAKVEPKLAKKVPEKPAEPSKAGIADQGKVLELILELMKKNDSVLDVNDAVNSVSEHFKISKDSAKKSVESLAKGKKIDISDGLIWTA